MGGVRGICRASVGRLAGAVRRVGRRSKVAAEPEPRIRQRLQLLEFGPQKLTKCFHLHRPEFKINTRKSLKESPKKAQPASGDRSKNNGGKRISRFFTFSRNFLAGVQRSDDPQARNAYAERSTSRLLLRTAFRIGSRRNSRRFSSSMTAQRTLLLKRPRRRNRQSPNPRCEFSRRLRTKGYGGNQRLGYSYAIAGISI